MMIIYGSKLCKDCVACLEDLDRVGVAYEYRDFSENLMWLKNFLQLREKNPIFAEAKEKGTIGIPCIVKENGELTLDWEEFIK